MLDLLLLFNSKENIEYGLRAVKRVFPFVMTFTVGLFLASAFNSPTTSNNHITKDVVNTFEHSTNKCGFGNEMKIVGDFDTTVFPPTPPETIILKDEIEKSVDK